MYYFRKERVSVVSATDRKFGVILDYKRKLEIVKRIQKQIDKFALKNEDLEFLNSWFCG